MGVSNRLLALNALLRGLAEQGLSQVEIAQTIGVSPQVLSDLKLGRRELSELMARRLEEAFGVDHRSLLPAERRASTPPPAPRIVAGTGCWLPVLPHPVECVPTEHPRWRGDFFHLPAVASRAVAQATKPYILRFGHDDIAGRLRKGDHLLMTQEPNDNAEIVVIRSGRKCFLARSQRAMWVRVATGDALGPDDPIVGHCLGIVWAGLT